MSNPHLAGTPTGGEEAAKRALGGVNLARSKEAFEVLGDQIEDRPALEYFLRPSPSDLMAVDEKILRVLRRNGLVLVPMHESEPGFVAEVLEYLVSRVPADRIIVSNDRSSEQVLRTVERFTRDGIHLIDKYDMYALIDWEKLLPVLGLTEPPSKGKGHNMLAAMLYAYLVCPNANAIVQHDADLKKSFDYDCLKALAYTLLRRKKGDRIVYSKVARPGRNNQSTMVARNQLHDLLLVPWLPEEVRQLALEVYLDLREHVWMLTGEFGLWRGLAYNRPFATGYGEETLTSLFVHDAIRHHPNGHREMVAQVVTPNGRFDESNGQIKEDRMMDRLARILLQYVLRGKPISTWNFEDYRGFNTDVLAKMELAARIPSEEDDEDSSPEDRARGAKLFGPVVLERLAMDRFIPGVKQLHKGGFLIADKVEAFKLANRR